MTNTAIAPTYYRTLLSPQEQQSYKTIVNGLLQHKDGIFVAHPNADQGSIQKLVQSVHLDHPELFFVNFWSYQYFQIIPASGFTLRFRMMLDQKTSDSVSNTLLSRSLELQKKLPAELSPEEKYYRTVAEIAANTTYHNSGSVFWEHTAAGPVLGHTAVCEGIAKLFLFFCQHLNLPCAVVTGTLNDVPHAWNMVTLNDSIRFVDVTGLLTTASAFADCPEAIFQTRETLSSRGYLPDL